MQSPIILAIDIGSSSVKAALVDPSCALLTAVGRQDFSLDRPVAGAAEVPVSRIWAAIVSAVKQILPREETGVVSGIGLSCMTPALVLLDRGDQPLIPVWTHLDRRSRPAARRAWEEIGPEFLTEVGNRPLPGGISAVCVAQLLQADPALRDRMQGGSYLHLNGWIGFHLTGEKVFDPANAGFTGLLPLRGNEWSDWWCRYFGVDPVWLAPVVDGQQTIGSLRPAVASELGLPPGLPVKIGTADTTSAMLAVGLTENDLLHVVGTTQVLLKTVTSPQPGERRLVRRLGVGDAYVHVTHNPVGGAALEWMHRLCFSDHSTDFLRKDDSRGSGARDGGELYLPFLGGDRLQIEPSDAVFSGLGLWSTREDMLGAVLAAMRKGHEGALSALGDEVSFRRVFLTGGGAETVRVLLPRYEGKEVHVVDNGSLRGVGKLFSRRGEATID